jgi:hypothetical protein
MSKDNDTSSICSAMSDVSISYNGEEMDLDDAIDHIFKELQVHINQTHVEIREICQWNLRGEDYEETKVYFDNMVTHITEGCALFKDLTKVIKQIMPPKPKA